MKYLKLTNSEECLKLAECLVGSRTNAVFFMQFLHGSDQNGFWVTDAGDDDYWIDVGIDKILLPLDTLKLNPFKCMEHGIEIVQIDKSKKIVQLGNIIKIDLVEDLITYSNSVFGEHCESPVNFLDYLSLDLENLPEGATVIEMDDE
jgi:hypothetical protein